MRISTTHELSAYLASTGESPEQLARRTQMSNMTIRRLLKRKPESLIPAKYQVQLMQASAPVQTQDFSHLMDDLLASGAKVDDLKQLRADLEHKLEDPNITADLRDKVRTVAAHAFSRTSLKSKALCLGALLYLINPFDLIPDTLGPIGYLDDFAVLTLVCDTIARQAGSKTR
jgi:uncharacterized membrane protein YkvA (DUF1232 family)